MIKSTKDYEIFKFRGDNRASICQAHIKRLIESIGAKNLLEMRPIAVNEDMEIIDGQHRFLAAKFLNLPIYYEINKDLKSEDIILMNVAKVWGNNDYLNYYCKNGNIEYQKLLRFMKESNVTLNIALAMIGSIKKNTYTEFKKGNFKFTNDIDHSKNIDLCWDTINFIKKMNGSSVYLNTVKFWKAITKLVNHDEFDNIKWKRNLETMVERFCVKASTYDYLVLLMNIYNWRSSNKINLIENEDFIGKQQTFAFTKE